MTAAAGALRLVPLYFNGRQELLDALARSIQTHLGFSVQLHPPSFDPELAFDSSRGQYNSRHLLSLLVQERDRDGGWVLGIAGVDLFIPVLTYVFGEAQLGGPAAIVSTHRLDPVAYGLPADEGLVWARVEKEVLHELGHCLGLLHCQDGRCVMRVSTYAEDIDLKTHRFCADCRAKASYAGQGSAT